MCGSFCHRISVTSFCHRISVTDFFSRIWGMRETNTNSKLEYLYFCRDWYRFLISADSRPRIEISRSRIEIEVFCKGYSNEGALYLQYLQYVTRMKELYILTSPTWVLYMQYLQYLQYLNHVQELYSIHTFTHVSSILATLIFAIPWRSPCFTPVQELYTFTPMKDLCARNTCNNSPTWTSSIRCILSLTWLAPYLQYLTHLRESPVLHSREIAPHSHHWELHSWLAWGMRREEPSCLKRNAHTTKLFAQPAEQIPWAWYSVWRMSNEAVKNTNSYYTKKKTPVLGLPGIGYLGLFPYLVIENPPAPERSGQP